MVCQPVKRSSVWLLLVGLAFVSARVEAHEGHGAPAGNAGATRTSPSAGVERRGTARVTLAAQPPHQGQVSKHGWQSFEVVYLPQETRVYFYTHLEDPLSARVLAAS